LVDRYALDASHLFDPFSGSAAILLAAQERGIRTTGGDLNPIAELFFRVKLNGFDGVAAHEYLREWINRARRIKHGLAIEWEAKRYWFTDTTIDKLERLRKSWADLRFRRCPETDAALLSVVLAIRMCSRADQRSPKPFISKQAREDRRGRHFDPYVISVRLLADLARLYPPRRASPPARFFRLNIARDPVRRSRVGAFSHLITSPPYINAQDYFRNFKLELYFLEGLLPFRVSFLRDSFIGTDRGHLLYPISEAEQHEYRTIFPGLLAIERRSPKLSAVILRYLHDMNCAFARIRRLMAPRGVLVIVCGDNLLAGRRVPTWQLLDTLITQSGFVLRDRFADAIGDRLLAPKRHGHRGLIKREVISAYERVST
jgi:hypothetical protein